MANKKAVKKTSAAKQMLRTKTTTKTKGVVTRRTKRNTIDFALFLKAVTEAFPARLAAGIHMAWLPDKSVWYASIHRFDNDGSRRTIALTATSSTSIQAAIVDLADKFKKMVAKPKQTNLENFIGD